MTVRDSQPDVDYSFESINRGIKHFSREVVSSAAYNAYLGMSFADLLDRAMIESARWRGAGPGHADRQADPDGGGWDSSPGTQLSSLVVMQLLEGWRTRAELTSSLWYAKLRYFGDRSSPDVIKLPGIVLRVLAARYIALISGDDGPSTAGNLKLRWRGVDREVSVTISNSRFGPSIQLVAAV